MERLDYMLKQFQESKVPLPDASKYEKTEDGWTIIWVDAELEHVELHWKWGKGFTVIDQTGKETDTDMIRKALTIVLNCLKTNK